MEIKVDYVSVQKLKPHPRNKEFFRKMQGEDWEIFLQDIKENGIRDPLKVTKDGTIIGGEQRWLASQEIGLEEVPVVYHDVSPQDAIHLLLLDNLSRRHLTPIEKAKIARVLKESWSVKAGNNEHNNEEGKSVQDIAEVIGESKRTTQRLMKLTDLIPELQVLVESGKLRQTSGESLAHLSHEEQKALYQSLGESLLQKTVQETKELRKAVEMERPDLHEGEVESAEAVKERVSTTLEKQAEEYEQKLLEEQQKTELAMNLVAKLEAELEAVNQGATDGQDENWERKISELTQRLSDAQERAKVAEIQMKELEVAGVGGDHLSTIQLGMWKQVTLMVKQLVKEYADSEEIKTEVQGISKLLEEYVNRKE